MGGEIKLSLDLELAEKEKVHAHILQASAHYGDPLTGETQEERSGRLFFENFMAPNYVSNHINGVMSVDEYGMPPKIKEPFFPKPLPPVMKKDADNFDKNQHKFQMERMEEFDVGFGE